MKQMKPSILVVFALTIIISSCQEKQVVQNEISIDELIGTETKEKVIGDSLNSEELYEQTDSSEFGLWLSELTVNYDTSLSHESTLFDRFKIENKKQINFHTRDSISEKTNLLIYYFSDTTSLNNAFYNWLDCFGADCLEVALNKNATLINQTPMICLIYPTKIAMILFEDGMYEKSSFWLNQVKFLFKGNQLKYRLDVDNNKKLFWR